MNRLVTGVCALTITAGGIPAGPAKWHLGIESLPDPSEVAPGSRFSFTVTRSASETEHFVWIRRCTYEIQGAWNSNCTSAFTTTHQLAKAGGPVTLVFPEKYDVSTSVKQGDKICFTLYAQLSSAGKPVFLPDSVLSGCRVVNTRLVAAKAGDAPQAALPGVLPNLGLPDLAVERGARPARWIVVNRGGAAPRSRLQLSDGQRQDTSLAIPALGAGARHEVVITPELQGYTKVVVDPGDAVKESNEGNNRIGR